MPSILVRPGHTFGVIFGRIQSLELGKFPNNKPVVNKLLDLQQLWGGGGNWTSMNVAFLCVFTTRKPAFSFWSEWNTSTKNKGPPKPEDLFCKPTPVLLFGGYEINP